MQNIISSNFVFHYKKKKQKNYKRPFVVIILLITKNTSLKIPFIDMKMCTIFVVCRLYY